MFFIIYYTCDSDLETDLNATVSAQNATDRLGGLPLKYSLLQRLYL
jgi:hypothetical protein